MLKLKIKNFGPITTGVEGDGWLDLKKVNVFIGVSASGKSTVAKLIYGLSKVESNAYFSHLEGKDVSNTLGSSINVSDLNMGLFNAYELDGYYTEDTSITVQSDFWNYSYQGTNRQLRVVSQTARANAVKLYIPSVRENALLPFDLTAVKGDINREFLIKLNTARSELKHIDVPFLIKDKSVGYRYDEQNRQGYVRINGNEVEVDMAASGIKAALPVKLLLDYIDLELKRLKANAADPNPLALNYIELSRLLSADDLGLYKRLERQYILDGLSVAGAKKKAANEAIPDGFLAVIDEPEQSLSPESQRGLLYYLIEAVNRGRKNTIVIPTHSPYIVHYIGLATRAHHVIESLRKTGELTEEIENRVNQIVPQSARISIDDVRLFSFENGAIRQLPDYKGSITDDFSLNDELDRLDQEYYQLIEMQYQPH